MRKLNPPRITARQWEWLFLLSVLTLTAVIRYGLLEVPFERDEGEYAYGGQLILQGLPVYDQLYSMKLPGIYAAYALLMTLFGQTHGGIHLGLLVINSLTIVLVFFLAKRLFDPLAASVASANFAVLSISPSVGGVFANAEHFVILPVVGGALLLIRAVEEDRLRLLFLSALMFGLGFIMKQHGIMFIAFGGVYLLIENLQPSEFKKKKIISRIFVFSFGSIVPYGLICLTFYLTGSFDKFWFWTFEYARVYSSQIPIHEAWPYFKFSAIPMGRSMFPIWILAGIGLSVLLLDKQLRRRFSFIFLFTLFSILAVIPGFYFRHHYFILILPATALLSGIAISSVVNILSYRRSLIIQYGLPVFIAVLSIFVSVYQQRNFLFKMTPAQASRYVYNINPFPESIEIARYIKEHTNREDLIAVLGSEPQIYFYSNRLSASPYIYMYELVKTHDFSLQMQKEMINKIELSRPKFLINISIKTSWLARPNSHQLIFEWLKRHQARYYELVGLVDISLDKTEYQWAPDIKKPPGPNFCSIWQRMNK